MSEVAEKAAEATAEVVEEAVDGVVEVVEVVRNNYALMGVVLVAGVAAGTGLGYFLAAKKLGKEFDARLADEVQWAKEFYASFNKVTTDGDPITPQEVMTQRHGPEAAAAAVRDYQGLTPDEDGLVEIEEGILVDPQDEAQMTKIEKSIRVETPEGDAVTVTENRNVFKDPHFDLEEEMKHRSEDKPYIIHHDEFYEAALDYDTIQLTYYEVDDTLVNEQDKPVEETDKMIGDDHLVRFGHGSKDPKIVYVRNDILKTDFEIVKSTGSYLEEVLGIPEDDTNSLKHSDHRDQRRAFRRGEG